MRAREAGLATVELAVTGAVALTILFGCIEIGRALFVWNTLVEATRRGAHIAAICPVDDPAIKHAVLMGEGDASPVLFGFRDEHVGVAYLDEDGNIAADFEDIEYVSVSVTGFQHTLLIPYAGATLTVPAFTTTVPAESLGYIPETGLRTCLEG